MNTQNEIKPPEFDPKTKLSLSCILWLGLGLIPAVAALCAAQSQDLSRHSEWFWILNGVCSIAAGFGFWHNYTKKRLLRGLAGMTMGGAFFFLNFLIVTIVAFALVAINSIVAINQGCCR